MKPAPFDFLAAASVDEAVAALADEDAKVIAGGQSLLPLLALRLARPTVLVDIGGLDFDHVDPDPAAGIVRLGALVRHRRLELDPDIRRAVPLLAEAAGLIGYPAIRNRGTLGGSLAHADAVAELPAVLVALRGTVVTARPGGEREIPAGELFEGFLTTSLDPDEVIVEVRLPHAAPTGHGAAFCEWAPREGDFAVAGVGVTLERDSDGVCASIGAAACGVSSVPVDLSAVLAGSGVLGASTPSDTLLRSVAQRVEQACVGAEGDRPELAGLLAARAVRRAFARAGNAAEAEAEAEGTAA